MSVKLSKCISCSTLNGWKSIKSGGSIVKYLKVASDTLISVPTAVNYIFRLSPEQKLVNKDGVFFGCCSVCALLIAKLYKLHKKLDQLSSAGSVIQELISTQYPDYQTSNSKVFQFVNSETRSRMVRVRTGSPAQPADDTEPDDADLDDSPHGHEPETSFLPHQGSFDQLPSEQDPLVVGTVVGTQGTRTRRGPKRMLSDEERRAKRRAKNKRLWDKKPVITHGPCDYCGKVFYNKKPNWMELHTNMMHKHDTKFICRVCAKPCQNNKNRLRHERCHLNAEERQRLAEEEGTQTAFLCYECGKVLTSEKSLSLHAKCHEPPELRRMGCEQPGCTVTFMDIYSLRRHLRRKHAGDVQNPDQVLGLKRERDLDLEELA